MKNLFFSLALLVLISVSAHAVPMFAKKYDMSCVSCHTKPPALNKMGKKFIRDGFKLSTYEKSSLEMLVTNKFSEKKVPLDLLYVSVYDKDVDSMIQKIKVHMGGSLTKSLSFLGFVSSGWYLNSKDATQRFFEEKTSMYYFQYGLNDSKHVFRLGSMFPLAQFGEVRRSQRFAPFISKRYKKPSGYVSMGRIKGVEYSYLSDFGLLFIANAGEEVFSKKDEYNVGLNYDINDNLRIGALYNRLDDDNSFIFPLEIEYNAFSLNSVVFYKDNSGEKYKGLENTFMYALPYMQQVRVMFNIDNDSNRAYSFEYNKIFEPVLGVTLQLTGSVAKVEKIEGTKHINYDVFQIAGVLTF